MEGIKKVENAEELFGYCNKVLFEHNFDIKPEEKEKFADNLEKLKAMHTRLSKVIGEVLKKHREKSGLSVEEAANKLAKGSGCNDIEGFKCAIVDYETNGVDDGGILACICLFLGFNINEIATEVCETLGVN